MKYLIYTLALISAFFVSANSVIDDESSPYHGYEYVSANEKQGTLYIDSSYGTTWPSPKAGFDNYFNYEAYAADFFQVNILTERVDVSGRFHTYFIKFETFSDCSGSPCNRHEKAFTRQFTTTDGTVYSCPDSYTIGPIEINNSQLCLRVAIIPEPCSEFGNNSFLPNKSGVGQAGENACYTNPTTGQQCQFKQGHDNFIATGKSCDGDENDYGDKPTPEPTPDGGDDNCYNYGSQGQVLICDVDPNEGCNALTINGSIQYQCPAGCGSMEGVYFCTYDDKDGDGKPDDKNQNGVPDKDETCENGRCKPNAPDNENPNPTPENPDMTSTNNRLDNISGELSFIGGKINKTNQTLDGINSGIQGMKQGQDKSNGLLTGVEKNTKTTAENTDVIAGNTKGILDSISETDIGDTFNPEGSSSFYESSYENGWQGVWDEKSDLIGQTGLFVFLKQFRLTSGGSAPEMNICFDVLVNLGCKTLDPNWERLMPFLRICIFITAAFVCRRIIFGG